MTLFVGFYSVSLVVVFSCYARSRSATFDLPGDRLSDLTGDIDGRTFQNFDFKSTEYHLRGFFESLNTFLKPLEGSH